MNSATQPVLSENWSSAFLECVWGDFWNRGQLNEGRMAARLHSVCAPNCRYGWNLIPYVMFGGGAFGR